jgi:hypothetical protein
MGGFFSATFSPLGNTKDSCSCRGEEELKKWPSIQPELQYVYDECQIEVFLIFVKLGTEGRGQRASL